MRHSNIIAAYLILMRDGKVLLLKRSNTGYHDGEYSLIAGHVEKGESFSDAILREAKEEVNISIEPQNLTVSHVMHRKSVDDLSERVDVYFVAKKYRGEVSNAEPGKCAEIQWFDVSELPEKIVPEVKVAITNTTKAIVYSELGFH